MKLSDMKITEADRKKRMEPSTLSTDAPAYPWGLCINLDNDTLEKLGLKLPKVGATMALEAQVKVTSCSSNDSEGGGKNASCSLQIVKMGVSKEDDDDGEDDTADRLYKK